MIPHMRHEDTRVQPINQIGRFDYENKNKKEEK